MRESPLAPQETRACPSQLVLCYALLGQNIPGKEQPVMIFAFLSLLKSLLVLLEMTPNLQHAQSNPKAFLPINAKQTGGQKPLKGEIDVL